MGFHTNALHSEDVRQNRLQLIRDFDENMFGGHVMLLTRSKVSSCNRFDRMKPKKNVAMTRSFRALRRGAMTENIAAEVPMPKKMGLRSA